MRTHPLSGLAADWTYSRNRGCNTAICSEHLITFRSSSAGFYDLAGDSGTGNLGGFRSGCTANLIPACGVLSAPDYTRTCTCAFQNRTSLALIHMPDVEMWTFNRYEWDGRRVRRLGLNVGAPGDRRAADGALWLDYPSVGGDSPDVPVTIHGESLSYFRYHPSHVAGDDLRWVAASGVRGVRSLQISLTEDSQAAAKPYTVRLVFAETEQVDVGARVFDVLLQGEPALVKFDVLAESGRRDHSVVKEIHNVMAGAELKLEFAARSGEPVLCGVEIVAEDW